MNPKNVQRGLSVSLVCLGLLAVDTILGPWQTTTSMTIYRHGLAAVTTGGYIYALGRDGDTGPYLANSVERAAINGDGSLNSWQAVSSMLSRRYELAAVTTGNYVYALGGEEGHGGARLSSVERAKINSDGSLDPWQASTPMTITRVGLGAVAVDDYIYALGGNSNSGGLQSSVERAKINSDGSLGSWQAVNSMTIPRYGLGAVAIGNYIYAIGGYSGSPLSSVERAEINNDGSLGSWQAISSMITPRYSLAAVAIANYLYAVGGYFSDGSGNIYLSSVERAKISSDGSLSSWQTVNSMTIPRFDLGAVVTGNYIYAIGGVAFPEIQSSVEQAGIMPVFPVYLPLVLKH